ncbi:hypothetical protein M446_5460 [Methylobacterium sp. 4-46]|uniref:hypothetical protein n=1 Tax=unclassified Methylobacterium TaxID=2615210 RepID=UPI000165CD5C|nr:MULTISPECIES: hypothetical protein [Methylobacterium]ACA19776.1 hypothetical protein M446_5460 [Methylobacterium sp. 4-46]WFT78964.1 hypothetical protein QA634_27505 [Methylobacterium nodulans]
MHRDSPSARPLLPEGARRSDDVQAELAILRAAAAAIDLQFLPDPAVAGRPAVQALIRAAWEVFRESGRDDASGEPKLN